MAIVFVVQTIYLKGRDNDPVVSLLAHLTIQVRIPMKGSLLLWKLQEKKENIQEKETVNVQLKSIEESLIEGDLWSVWSRTITIAACSVTRLATFLKKIIADKWS